MLDLKSNEAALIFRPQSLVPELHLPHYEDDEIVDESTINAVLAAALFTEDNADLLAVLYKRLENAGNGV